MSWFRRWFSWSFLLATIMAQVPHDHHGSSRADLLSEFGACDESHSHWAGHNPPGPDAGPGTCPLCQHRLQDLLPPTAPPLDLPVASSAHATRPPAVSFARTLLQERFPAWPVLTLIMMGSLLSSQDGSRSARIVLNRPGTDCGGRARTASSEFSCDILLQGDCATMGNLGR